MRLPNVLTLSRFVLAGILMMLIAFPFPMALTLALLVFVAASITDYLDGHLARHVYGVTAFGKLMDPLADKVMITAAYVSFVGVHLEGWPHSLVPAPIVVLIISREFLVTGLRLLAAGQGEIIAAGKWGKHKTVWQIIGVVVILLGYAIRNDVLRLIGHQNLAEYDLAFGVISLSISVAVLLITVASGGLYFYQHRHLISRHL